MDPGSFDHINKVVNQSGPQWLGEAYLPHYDRLVAATKALRRLDDEFVIPDRLQQGCWQELWPHYDRLRRRQQAAETLSEPERVFESARSAEIDRAWARYIEERPLLQQEIKRSGIAEKDCLAYLRLKDDDFIDPVDPSAPRGMRVGWYERADRIGNALAKWNGMTPDGRRMIPALAQAARSKQVEAQVTYVIDKFIPTVVDEFNALERRVLALEAANAIKAAVPTEKETLQ